MLKLNNINKLYLYVIRTIHVKDYEQSKQIFKKYIHKIYFIFGQHVEE